MNFIDFQRNVLQATSELPAHDYKHVATRQPNSVEFEKTLVAGVVVRITFELLSYPGFDMLKIYLRRRRLDDSDLSPQRFPPLYMNLRNLMLGLYKLDILPKKRFAWEFDNEASLTSQLNHATKYVLQYGIPWLEDPLSNIDAFRRQSLSGSSP